MPSVAAGAPVHRMPPGRRSLFALNASILVTLLAASSAPTPLYSTYQTEWRLSALAVTMVFSAYALALLLALLTTGGLSDHIGRRPVLLGALAMEAAAMVVFATAVGVGALITARVLQGLATGAATSAAGAALLDLENPGRPGRAALANSVAPAAGMASGVLISTLLVRYAPGPTSTGYMVLMLLFLVQALAVAGAPETARPHPGALRSLRPHVTLPSLARRALLLGGPGVIAIWALGGFYSSLGPAFARLIAPDAPQATDGMLFFALAASAALTVGATRRLPAATAATLGCCAVIVGVALPLAGLRLASLPLLFTGAVLAGVGFGAVSQGGLRMVLGSAPERERGGILAAYYVLSYLAMSVPVIGAGMLAERYGLRTAAYLYGSGVALLAALAVTTLRNARRSASRTARTPLPPSPPTGCAAAPVAPTSPCR